MAIYHCSIKIISRGKGKSAVAAAAYRSGEKITNDYDGITHDYTRKSGVVHTEILLPDNAPAEYVNCQSGSLRAVLWNAVEKIEKAKNSQLAREIELALPAELTMEQNISLARDYVRTHFVSAGMCADICIHDTSSGNPHAHILLTMRPFEQCGTWGAKSRKEYVLDENGERIKLKSGEFKSYKLNTVDWNEPTKAEQWRAAWEIAANAALEKYSHESRIDHRSYERQNIEQIPTVHMGVAATQMERKGIVTERGNMNREISRINQILFAIKAKLKQFKGWLKAAVAPAVNTTKAEKPSIMTQLDKYKKAVAETKNPEPPPLADLYARFEAAHKNLKRVDVRLKSANGAEEYNGILPERHKAYAAYSALKAEVKKAEKNLPQKKPRSRDMER